MSSQYYENLDLQIHKHKRIYNGHELLTFKTDSSDYLLFDKLKKEGRLSQIYLFKQEFKQRYDLHLDFNYNHKLTSEGKFLLTEEWTRILKDNFPNKKIKNEHEYSIKYNEKEDGLIISNLKPDMIPQMTTILMEISSNMTIRKLPQEHQNRYNALVKSLDPKETEYILINKLVDLNPNKYSKEVLYNLSKPTNQDTSKTLYEAIDRGAILEGIEITDYTREQLSQKIVELIQDGFKDYKEKWRLNKLEDKDVITFLDNHFIRQREYQRWSDDELKNLWHLWKYECKRVSDCARLMQRSTQSCERMIDFIERYGQKYQNLENHYKRIITKAGVFGG
jgi:hypothetical protein